MPTLDLRSLFGRSAPSEAKRFGLYRGRVIEANDPSARARLKVLVPEVLGDVSVWAMPALRDPDIAHYSAPPVGANVWIAFEAGDVSRPVWTGFF
jgi:Type VI secretion system/phage-baseplate injector OB domain